MSCSHARVQAALLGFAAFAASAAVNPDPIYQSMRQAPIAESFAVENIVLHRDAGTLTLKSGSIGFTAPVQGRDTVAVFSGEAELTLAPATAIEKNHLKSVTEQESIKETFDRALFCFTDDSGKEIRSQAKTKSEPGKLNDILREGGGNFAVGARESWYPNVNTFHDHAVYDLTFRVPKAYTLVSVGQLEKEWVEKDTACSHWVSAVPLAVAGFNYGTFKKKAVADPKLGAIEGYATSETPDYLAGASDAIGAMGHISASSLMEGTLVDARNALGIYSAWFGRSEFDRIAITQQPQFDFGQSWPSLVYLPMLAYLDSTQRFRLMQASGAGARENSIINQFVDEVTAHEVSHQWWGHMVGGATYHDQWLSEGFADFSAGLFLQFTEKTTDKFQKYWEHARHDLTERNQYGRRANDAGPVWLGRRLSTEKNGGAYDTVVYRKGGFVLHMLRQMMWDRQRGDANFQAMMQDFVHEHLNRNATTESFQRVVEKHMTPAMNIEGNGRMDWFFSEWVYGTTLPKYTLDYTVTPADGGKFLLKGQLAQVEVPADFRMPVPIYVDFDGNIVRIGQARMIGSSTLPIQLELPRKPKRVMINYYHDVLEQ